MATYKAAVIGCSRMGAFIDNEIPLKQVTIQGMAVRGFHCVRGHLADA